MRAGDKVSMESVRLVTKADNKAAAVENLSLVKMSVHKVTELEIPELQSTSLLKEQSRAVSGFLKRKHVFTLLPACRSLIVIIIILNISISYFLLILICWLSLSFCPQRNASVNCDMRLMFPVKILDGLQLLCIESLGDVCFPTNYLTISCKC